MKEELEKFAEWLWKEKNLSVFDDIEEYILTRSKPKKTLDELFHFVAVLNMVDPRDLKVRTKHGKVGRARGMIVKYLLHHRDKLLSEGYNINSLNVFKILFGFYYRHDTALYYKNDVDYIGEELKIYNKIVNFIETYDIEWYDKSESSNN